MGVIKYDEGEHGGGFIGFRVSRTVGINTDYRNRYFTEKKHGWPEAERLAGLQDKKWEKQALEFRRSSRLLEVIKTPKNPAPNIIVSGFRAVIEVDKKTRAGELRTYFSPGFTITGLSAKTTEFFRIKRLGYQGAYIKAAKKYCDLHNIPTNARLSLIAKKPDKEIFTGFLRQRAISNGHRLTLKTLNAILDSDIG